MRRRARNREINDKHNPFRMSELGEDFFMNRDAHNIVWYIDPNTKKVHHSGTKERDGKAGKRWCSICQKSVSSNNFLSQHLRTLHAHCKTSMQVWNAISRFL